MPAKVKVTMNPDPVPTAPTPTEQIIAKAAAEVVITDPRGRTIKLRKPGVLAQFRLIEALGDTARNEVYVGMVMPLLYIATIDGEPAFPPSKKSEVEALIQQLDEDGISAISEAVFKNFGQSNPDAEKAALKN